MSEPRPSAAQPDSEQHPIAREGDGGNGAPGAPVRWAAPAAGTGSPMRAGERGIPASGLRREILLRLRRHGPLSPDQIAAGLRASRTGVLQQLRGLEDAGLVTRQTVRHGVGRPRHLYDVTTDAQDLFPSNYDGLAGGLLAAIAQIGGDDLVEQVFEARRRQIGRAVRSRIDERVGPRATLVDRVEQLAAIQDEQGYLADAHVEPDGTVVLREHNCAIYHVATDTAVACRAELELFRDVLGAGVVRETHIAAGDRCCTYRVASSRGPS
jgi:predicted ArsR family transcriptional regulator